MIDVLFYVSGVNFSGATKMTVEAIERLDRKIFRPRAVFEKYDHRARHVTERFARIGVPTLILGAVWPAWLTRRFGLSRFERWLARWPALRQARLSRFLGIAMPDILCSNGRPLSELPLQSHEARQVYYIHFVPELIGRLPQEVIDEMASADKVIAVGSAQRNALAARGVPASIMSIVANGVRATPFNADGRRRLRETLGLGSKDLLVGAVGGISLRKGVDRFLAVAEAIGRRNDCADMRFLWLGGQKSALADCPGGGDLLRRAEQLGDRVVFAGPVADPADWFSAFDVFLLLSTNETTDIPLALAEAMWAKRPCLTTWRGNEDEQRLPADCLLDDDHPEAVAERLVGLLRDTEWRKMLGKQVGAVAMAELDIEQTAGAFAKALAEHLVSEHTTG
jgi:glycosyltransferase involved in cell wall biosynthesis